MKTLQQKYIAALELRGEVVVPGRSGKYVTMTRSVAGGFYFLGRSGALRFGPSSSRSQPCSNKFKAKLLEELKKTGEVK